MDEPELFNLLYLSDLFMLWYVDQSEFKQVSIENQSHKAKL